MFSKNCPTIVIKDISSGKTTSKLLNPKTPSSSTVPELTNDEQLCIKLNDLIRRGKIQKDKILYRYLSDVVEIMYNPFHEYDREVVEFFNTITYLGGRRTANFIRGPMNLGDGRHSHINKELDKKMNLGGPSESLILKSQAGYTPDSGVIKPLSLAHVELLKNSGAKPLIETTNVVVIPCALANDGTALKPAIEFDARIN